MTELLKNMTYIIQHMTEKRVSYHNTVDIIWLLNNKLNNKLDKKNWATHMNKLDNI